jgi:hypothetical protein
MALPYPAAAGLQPANPTDTAASRAFPATSRYYAIPTASYTTPEGQQIAYLTRRFCPRGQLLPLLSRQTVQADERLDQLTARALGDPTQFWRVADANNAMNPFDLMTPPGRARRVPVPGYTPPQT